MGNCLPRNNHSSVVTEILVQSDELETKNGGIILTSDAEMKKFSLNELKKATKNFGQDMVLGMGGFGKVYKGWINGKTYAPSKIGVGLAVAVKQSYSHGSQGFKEWQSEVHFLGKFSHPNLVKLVGCCSEDDEYILVYEYLQKGSLDSHLFRKGAESSLSWGRRLKIAVGAARGLSFLHNTEKQVIYRDFKSSNILLDRDYNAKLSDFGLAKFGPTNGQSHLTTLAMGTLGYVAPEYLASGHLYVKSDVYGFGVVLLELLTGLRVLDTSRPIGQTDLVGWARPSLSDRSKLEKIMDLRLGDDYPLEGAFQVAAVVLGCLEADPKKRPSMEHVLETLNRVSRIKITAKGLRSFGGTRRPVIGQR